MKIDLIAGARPNFVKIAAIVHAIKTSDLDLSFRIIHTGQHYSRSLSDSFFEDLEIPEPTLNLRAGSGTQAEQTSAIMLAYEEVLLKDKPDICVVVGDVTSSMACAITAKKLQIRVAHIEAGIRSGDHNMPEEINRLIIDSISDYFFTTTQAASRNLTETGVASEHIFFVGNTMIDSLLKFRPKFKKPMIWEKLQLTPSNYIVVTLHRPSNVDQANTLKKILSEIIQNSEGIPIIFPAHPRSNKSLKEFNSQTTNFYIIEPLGYLEFNYLVENAKAVITDSGGVTEETTVLGVPCMTIRDTTERPETVTMGTNELLGTKPTAIAPAMKKLFQGSWKKGNIPELWDGKTGERIVEILNRL